MELQPRALNLAAPVFAALGDRTRLRLLARLGKSGPLATPRLGAGARISRQAIAKHLQVLAEAGLVRAVRRGREAVWQLQTDRLQDARSYLEEVSRQWDHALGSLKAFVESTP
jgi:DNA-binding transcriptional ArsR family regulator